MARTFTPEEIAEMKAFLRAHPPDPAYDEEDELFDGKLPPEEPKARCRTAPCFFHACLPCMRGGRALFIPIFARHGVKLYSQSGCDPRK